MPSLPVTVRHRAAELSTTPRGTYVDRLVTNAGSLEDAARVDLAIDGRLAYVDLRRRPFAGNPELKSLYRSANLALEELRGALINFAWKDPNA